MLLNYMWLEIISLQNLDNSSMALRYDLCFQHTISRIKLEQLIFFKLLPPTFYTFSSLKSWICKPFSVTVTSWKISFSCICLLYNSEESEETLKNTKEIQKKAEEKYEVLENKMKNAEAEREKELKDAQKKLDCARTKADASSKKMKEKQQVIFF